MQRLHGIVHGRVQGVGFRHATTVTAYELGLSGWVRNLPDGTVEVMAEGDQATLSQLALWLHEGPPGSRVDSVLIAWGEATGEFRGFAVTYG